MPENVPESTRETPATVETPVPGVSMDVRSLLSANALSMRADIDRVHSLIAKRTSDLNSLVEGLSKPGTARDTLEALLERAGLEKTDKTRYAAYVRLANLREDGLKNHLEEIGLPAEEKDAVLLKAFEFAEEYHVRLHEALISEIEGMGLLTPFYRQLLRGVHSTGLAFNRFHKAWNGYLINGLNRKLEKRFGGDQGAVMGYLAENGLFDRGHGGEIADRSYSVLRECGDGYVVLAYVDAFPREVADIVAALDAFVTSLEGLEDVVYGQKDAYVSYLRALKTAFLETDVDSLVARWADVDVAWMGIRTPFQIGHPLEYYEDKFRKAVAPEWDLRLKNDSLFESNAKGGMETAFRKFAGELGLSEESEAYVFSLSSLNRTQLYVSAPMFYYGSCLTGLPSAQVVPNDAEVSKRHGKKIFSFAENVLKQYRARPQMKLNRLTVEKGLRQKRKDVVFGPDERFYELYDTETIGHEFGHTLWMELDTESRMNASGNSKNVEEWKATSGGVVAFFLNPREELKEPVVVDLVMRSIGLIGWMKEEEVRPYYCEALIHLDILFGSGTIFINGDGLVELNLNGDTYEALKSAYLRHYGKLAEAYLRKEDASIFLSEYAVSENGVFLPKDGAVRKFVENYYALYEEFGNAVDTETE
ncbi:MAG: hypothetical protein QG650_239 [Patescibacteria group bacterium]|nr:hypothetical protein [Patescibacteria group bacterium]